MMTLVQFSRRLNLAIHQKLCSELISTEGQRMALHFLMCAKSPLACAASPAELGVT